MSLCNGPETRPPSAPCRALRAPGHDPSVNSRRYSRHRLRAPVLPGGTALRRTLPRRARHRSQGSRVLAVLLTLTLAAILVIGTALGVFGVAAIATVGALSTDLPDPATLEQLTFAQPTIVYDRTGKIQLARFQKEERRVVAYADVPKLVVDATTTAEDRTFWNNAGFDPAAIR